MLQDIFNKIEGDFNYPQIYSDMIDRFPNNSIFIEVGSYKGKSLLYLLMESQKRHKTFNIVAIDNFIGVEGYSDPDLLDVFNNNTKQVSHLFTLINGNSWESASLFKDKSVDFIFIDASHLYEHVIQDIKAWLPKVKEGGVIAGHDYGSVYCGVPRAVGEVFGDRFNKKYIDESCWMYEVNT